MPWKMDGDKIAMMNGDPIWITDDNKETTIAGGTIGRLNAEAKAHREAKEAAETKLKTFDGIDDPAAAKAALVTVSKLDSKQLIDAGKVDEVKAEINKSWETKHTTVVQERDGLRTELDNLRLTNAFASSQFIKDRVAVPPDMFFATFKDRFKIENGKLIPQKADGSGALYSEKRHGEIADVDEAFELMLKDHPHRDSILKAAQSKGSGNSGGGGNQPGSGQMRRSEFAALRGAEHAAKVAELRNGTLKLVD